MRFFKVYTVRYKLEEEGEKGEKKRGKKGGLKTKGSNNMHLQPKLSVNSKNRNMNWPEVNYWKHPLSATEE